MNDLFGIKDKDSNHRSDKKYSSRKRSKDLKENKKIETQASLINSFDDLLEICSL